MEPQRKAGVERSKEAVRINPCEHAEWGLEAAGTRGMHDAALSYGSPVTLVVKNLPDDAGDIREGLDPWM